jgi:hypothetical protein
VTVKIKHPRVHADHDTTPDVGPAVAPIAQSVSLSDLALQLAGKSDQPTVDIGPH